MKFRIAWQNVYTPENLASCPPGTMKKNTGFIRESAGVGDVRKENNTVY